MNRPRTDWRVVYVLCSTWLLLCAGVSLAVHAELIEPQYSAVTQQSIR